MRRNKKRSQSRNIIAITLIVASFLSAYVLSSLANRTVLIWSARVPLTVGSKVSVNDLVPERVALPEGNAVYLTADRDIDGFLILRAVKVGELLPKTSVSARSESLNVSAVPIKVNSADLPADITVGEVVNIYHVGDSQLSKEIEPPSLVLSRTSILGINRKGENLGGDLSLTVSTSTRAILQLLAATSSGHFVVVRVNG
ncbi:MAG: hypothetical protein HY050_07155 [Actinobacteria bacterium]|nr:hypothetical protein [Actinomycetota bacterium]